MAASKRTELTLKQKVELIKASAGQSSRQLAEKFAVGRTQVQTILKRKAELMTAYEENGNSSRKRACYRSDYEDIDELTWRWFQRVRGLNTPVSGPMIQHQALDYAKELQKPDFKASNGWLSRFKSRHNIGCATLSGERASVNPDTVASWKERLPDIIKNFAPRDVYNMDETGLFFRALPDKSLTVRGTDCAGGKKSKDRLTVAVCVNAVGEFETPLVIGHAQKPRCFKNLDINRLPVKWVANKKAWMTGFLFKEWITAFNRRMRAGRRHVLLLLDNAPSHPQDLELSNTTVKFLPANTTSVLQPLDLGIIKNIKCHYRTRLLRAVLSKVETASSAAEVAKSVNCLDACHWIRDAVRDVKPLTVQRCFGKAGVPPQQDLPDDDPEDDLPLAQLLAATVDRLQLPEPMTVEAYCEVDAGLPATEELPAGWEQDLAADFCAEIRGETVQEEEEEEEGDRVTEPAITTFAQSIKWTSELKQFAAEKGLDSVLADLAAAEDKLQQAFMQGQITGRQTCLEKFFNAV